MYLKIPKRKQAVSLLELSFPFQLRKRRFDLGYQRNGNVQRMMPGQNFFNFIFPYPFYRAIKQLRIGGRVKRIERSFVYQISRIQILPFRLVKTAMSGRMPRRVNDLNLPPAQIQKLAVAQDFLRRALKDLIGVKVKIAWKIASNFCQIVLHGFERKRKTVRKLILFRFVYGNIVKIFMSADVIPMHMSRQYRNWQFRQRIHNFFDVGNAQPCIDENGSILSAQQVAVRLFPMFVFADSKRITINLLNGKPATHFNSPKPLMILQYPQQTAPIEYLYYITFV